MQYRAILKCRECAGNRGKSTTNTVLFTHDSEGGYTPSLPNAQDTIDKFCRLNCDKCGEDDWRVIEVQQLREHQHGN